MPFESINSLETNQVSDLCVNCNMCCDGTLYSHVGLKSNEKQADFENIGFTFNLNEKKEPVFNQPCVFSAGSCQVYHDRPSTCRNFYCQPLKEFSNSKITWDEVKLLIINLKKLSVKIKQITNDDSLFTGKSIYEIAKLMRDNIDFKQKEMVKKYGFLLFFIDQYWTIRRTHFTTLK